MESHDQMTVLIVEPQQAPYVKEIGTGLKSLQAEVGGFIEAVYPYQEPVALIVNDEGKLDGLPLNRALRDQNGTPYDIVAGTMIVAGLDEDNFCSLSDKLISQFTEKFQTPEQFITMNGKLLILPMEPVPDAPSKSEVPVYHNTGAYAVAHDELEAYRTSLLMNMECKEAVERAIADHYADNHLGKDAAADVLNTFGTERVSFVLANMIQQIPMDGRISPENKSWANEFLRTDAAAQEHPQAFTLSNIHPGLINLFTDQVHSVSDVKIKDRPSVRAQLHETHPAPSSPKKQKEHIR